METKENILIDYTKLTVGKIVAKDYRKAMVFKSHGVDFCCGGGISIESAIEDKDVSLNTIIEELEKIDLLETVEADYENWPTKRLVEHIIEAHHRYVERTIAQLTPMLAKVEMVHGEWRPELTEINRLYLELSQELLMHMKKEEQILFPAILTLDDACATGANCFGSVQNPITMMEHEHDIAGDLMKKINELTDGYTLPKGACATYTVVYSVLKEFEADLFTHIHLENNILFPRAIKLEKSNN